MRRVIKSKKISPKKEKKMGRNRCWLRNYQDLTIMNERRKLLNLFVTSEMNLIETVFYRPWAFVAERRMTVNEKWFAEKCFFLVFFLVCHRRTHMFFAVCYAIKFTLFSSTVFPDIAQIAIKLCNDWQALRCAQGNSMVQFHSTHWCSARRCIDFIWLWKSLNS